MNTLTVTRICSLFLFFCLFIAVLLYSWVTDDAFITFRVVRNFVEGYGPVFNIGERVQAFTHPLWFFLLSIGGFLKIQLYYWALILGYFFSILLIILLYKIAKDSNYPLFSTTLCVGILLPSEVFLSFQTSGLENSLTNFLLVFIIIRALIQENEKNLFIVSFLTSFLLLNRLDQLFLIMPLCIYCFTINPSPYLTKIKVTILGMLPLIIWEFFSLIYYGFLFPNTKYAKIGARDTFESMYYGLQYLSDFLLFEPLQFLLIILLPIYIIYKYSRSNWFLVSLAMGVTLQILYIIISASDFMRGRFLLSSLIVVCIMLLYIIKDIKLSNLKYFGVSSIIIIILFAFYNRSVVHLSVPNEHNSVHNERDYYKEYLAINWENFNHYKQHPWAIDGRKLNEEYKNTNKAIIGVNGQRAYNVDSEIALIDLIGLPDAFIARCPVIDASRSGHYHRSIPREYLQERSTGMQINQWENPDLEKLWRDLQIIINSESFFTYDRFHSMFRVWRNYGM